MTNAKKAVAAVKAIMHGLATSDFPAQYGSTAVQGLDDFKADMAADIIKHMTGQYPTEDEQEILVDPKSWEDR